MRWGRVPCNNLQRASSGFPDRDTVDFKKLCLLFRRYIGSCLPDHCLAESGRISGSLVSDTCLSFLNALATSQRTCVSAISASSFV